MASWSLRAAAGREVGPPRMMAGWAPLMWLLPREFNAHALFQSLQSGRGMGNGQRAPSQAMVLSKCYISVTLSMATAGTIPDGAGGPPGLLLIRDPCSGRGRLEILGVVGISSQATHGGTTPALAPTSNTNPRASETKRKQARAPMPRSC